ncbi:LAME_0F19064g1_1 [Lachancea meyersii CBS 8951]|uniref:Putative lipoate-protein ligase A n=1 Tax=Lachancea meyersii CBS 8951 TaxID=1266667 RepID=A0A1G4K140_9SACH|nr:LAME_0F19064g1_1 [Lachancea meyersii CBS 8951]
MFGIVRGLKPACGLSLGFKIYCRSLGSAPPFDLDLDAQNDKFSDLNNMYTEMFTNDGLEPSKLLTSSSKSATHIYDSEVDELNAEFTETYDFSPKIICGQELTKLVEAPGRFIIQSLSNNPYYNLAVEDYVFKNTPVVKGHTFLNERLLFYVNGKCAVIGKNQTPWKELFLQNCKSKGYRYVRRLSGGGAVVHDLGNVNYSYLTSRDAFQREYFNQKIVGWLKEARPGTQFDLNERGDIHLDGFKVSGSAFKIARGKSYHHGTMLVDSDLASFRGLLKPAHIDNVSWSGGSVDSVRSRVKNIQGAGFKKTGDFIDICVQGFRTTLQEDVPLYLIDEEITQTDAIMATTGHLASDEWLYDSGPKFVIALGREKLSVEKGLIADSTIPGLAGQHFTSFVESFNKGKFGDFDVNI